MPSFKEIEKENNPKNTIIKYAKKLHEKTGRNIIIYSSSFLTNDEDKVYIDSIDKNGFMAMIKDLDISKGLDLILHTPGGMLDATESIIDYLHAIFGSDIRTIVPLISMSEGTLIACSSKKILMGKHSSLGPVDPQMGEISAQNIIKEFELAKKEISEDSNLIPFWEILLDKYDENILIESKKAIKWTEYILEKSLRYSMFPNDDGKIEKIKYDLITGSTTKDHSQNLSPERCRRIGLKIENIEEDNELQDIILSIHHAYMSYFNHTDKCKLFANQIGTFMAISSKKMKNYIYFRIIKRIMHLR